MNGSEVALDTSAAVGFLNNVTAVREKLLQFERFIIPVPALGELYFGVWNSQQLARNQQKLELFVADCTLMGVTPETARIYARVRLDLKRRGKPIPDNDLWIAAVCLEHHLPLATNDSHFSHITDMVVLTP